MPGFAGLGVGFWSANGGFSVELSQEDHRKTTGTTGRSKNTSLNHFSTKKGLGVVSVLYLWWIDTFGTMARIRETPISGPRVFHLSTAGPGGLIV